LHDEHIIYLRGLPDVTGLLCDTPI